MTANELPPIPDAYQKVEYVIATHAGSNINTGVAGNNDNLRIKCCALIEDFVAYQGFIGNYSSETANCWRIITQSVNNGKFYVTLNGKTNASATLVFSESFIGKRVYVDLQYANGRATIDNTTKKSTKAESGGTENDRNIAYGYHFPSVGTGTPWRRRLYYCMIWDNGTLIRCYVPCYRKSDNKVGFYDTVNDTFNTATAVDFILP